MIRRRTFSRDDLRRLLSQQRLFGDCPEVVAQILTFAKAYDVPAQEAIYKEDEPVQQAIYLILSGSVELWRSRSLVAPLSRNEFFGEFPLLDPAATYTVTVMAAEPTVIAKIPWPELASLADSFPGVWRNLAALLAQRLRQGNRPQAAAFLGEAGLWVDNSRAFIAMPYSVGWSGEVEAVISNTCKLCGFEPAFAKHDDGRLIIQSLWRSITQSGVVIADISGANPNVCYEVGLADAAGREVILLILVSVQDEAKCGML